MLQQVLTVMWETAVTVVTVELPEMALLVRLARL